MKLTTVVTKYKTLLRAVLLLNKILCNRFGSKNLLNIFRKYISIFRLVSSFSSQLVKLQNVKSFNRYLIEYIRKAKRLKKTKLAKLKKKKKKNIF